MKSPWQVAFEKVSRNVADVRSELRRSDGESEYKSGFDDALRGCADAIKLAMPRVSRVPRKRAVKVSKPDARATVADALNELAPV